MTFDGGCCAILLELYVFQLAPRTLEQIKSSSTTSSTRFWKTATEYGLALIVEIFSKLSASALLCQK